MIGAFWAFALIVYALMEWAIPVIYSGTLNAPSGFNYGSSFVVPFSRAFAPWIAGAIVFLGVVTAVRTSLDRFMYRRKPAPKRR